MDKRFTFGVVALVAAVTLWYFLVFSPRPANHPSGPATQNSFRVKFLVKEYSWSGWTNSASTVSTKTLSGEQGDTLTLEGNRNFVYAFKLMAVNGSSATIAPAGDELSTAHREHPDYQTAAAVSLPLNGSVEWGTPSMDGGTVWKISLSEISPY